MEKSFRLPALGECVRSGNMIEFSRSDNIRGAAILEGRPLSGRNEIKIINATGERGDLAIFYDHLVRMYDVVWIKNPGAEIATLLKIGFLPSFFIGPTGALHFGALYTREKMALDGINSFVFLCNGLFYRPGADGSPSWTNDPSEAVIMNTPEDYSHLKEGSPMKIAKAGNYYILHRQ